MRGVDLGSFVSDKALLALAEKQNTSNISRRNVRIRSLPGTNRINCCSCDRSGTKSDF
jgi:hypothetical protein